MRRQIWRSLAIGPAAVVFGAWVAVAAIQAQPGSQSPRHLPWRPLNNPPAEAMRPQYPATGYGHPSTPTLQARAFPSPPQNRPGIIPAAFPASSQQPGAPIPPPAQPQSPADMQATARPQTPPQSSQPGPERQPIRVAERPQAASSVVEQLASMSLANHPEFHQRIGNEHPIMPALRWAKAGLPYVEALDDYCCTLVKQERVNGELKPPQQLFLKVRHRPFSVYVYFLTPEAERGQEAIYVHGQNDGCLLAHGVGIRSVIGTVSLKPDGMLAMNGNRYPITHVGLANLLRELIAVGENDIQYGESEVKFYHGAKVNGRICTCVEFRHPVPRREFRYHIARIFVDDELNLPVHYEAYDWPEKPGGEPVLTERYTYLNLKLNNGFTDLDFDIRNPNYGFDK